jgi:hypothetical protein
MSSFLFPIPISTYQIYQRNIMTLQAITLVFSKEKKRTFLHYDRVLFSSILFNKPFGMFLYLKWLKLANLLLEESSYITLSNTKQNILKNFVVV